MVETYFKNEDFSIYCGDCLEILRKIDDCSVNCVVTSPPYFNLRDYSSAGQIGIDQTPAQYISNLVSIFHEVKRVLKKDGTCWLNIGDSYNGSGKSSSYSGNYDKSIVQKGHVGSQLSKKTKVEGLKSKDLIGIPWMLAFALRDHGWYLRQDIIWRKNNPVPESVKDRCTRSHEYIFLLSKSRKYFYNYKNMQEKAIGDGKTRNKRDVWDISVGGNSAEGHHASFPPRLAMNCILAGSNVNDIILDPFVGSGTTISVARQLGRKAIGIDICKNYCDLTIKRANINLLK